MLTEENMALVRRYAEEGWGKKNLAVMDELVAPDMVDHNPIGMMDQHQGAEGVKRTILSLQTAFPDFSLTIEEMLADQDKVALRWTIRGTHQGTLMGIAPTGKAVSWSGVNIFRLTGGKIVEESGMADIAGLLQQLGALPMHGQAS
ncbi:MAG: ester cyclase [Chloroflexi bacterium]|nr:MAG: ester cyclase [Chloroflexota bacterium]